jgi:hypothetical protein
VFRIEDLECVKGAQREQSFLILGVDLEQLQTYMIPKPSLTLEDLEILHQLQDDSPQIRAEKTSR